MYLGQCMQMQSDNSAVDSSKRAIVPFRQCKLTELLFSNSFPSAHSHSSSHHHHALPRVPQKAIMVVTADPFGDYNATSQILRYSALAREVTVPRVPSATGAIQLGTTTIRHATDAAAAPARPPTAQSASGRITPSAAQALEEQLDNTLGEVARLGEQLDVLHLRLRDERARRVAAEASWRAAEENMVEVEAGLREELYAEYEGRLEALQRRYKASWDEEADRKDECWDRKVEILTKGIAVHEDDDEEEGEGRAAAAERIAELEDENDALRRQVEALRRDQQARSPSKTHRQVGRLASGPGAVQLTPKASLPLRTPSRGNAVLPGARKQRVLKAKRWEVENDPFDSE